MTGKRTPGEIDPDLPPHVGETIREVIAASGMIYQRQLALKMGVSEKYLSQLLIGDVPLTSRMALLIEAATGASAELLMCLQVRHEVAVLRRQRQS